MRRQGIAALCAAALGCAAAANYFIYLNAPTSEPLAPLNPASPEIAAPENLEAKVPASELLLVHTQTRPLFSPTRRKWVEPVPPPPAALELTPQPAPAEPLPAPAAVQTPPPDVTLIGIEKSPSGAKALLMKSGGSDALWLKSGEQLEGWAIHAIDASSVEMTLGERKIKLELYPQAPSPGLEP
jgi:hypothetical protein